MVIPVFFTLFGKFLVHGISAAEAAAAEVAAPTGRGQ